MNKEDSPLKRIQNKDGKWNLKNIMTDEVILNTWFDNLGTWSAFKKDEYNIHGWDGLIFLEEPVKTTGAYPYSVRARLFHYSSVGGLISVSETTAGIWGPK